MMKKLLIIWLALVAAVYGAELGTIGLYDELAIPVDGVVYEDYGLKSTEIGMLTGTNDVVIPSEASSYGDFDYDAIMFMLLSRSSSVLVHFEISGVTYYLPDLTVTEPTTNYPVSFAAFDPSTFVNDESPVDGVPEIAEWTRQNDPEDTMALTGEELDVLFAGFVFYGEGDGVSAGDIQRLDGQQAAVTLPSALPADDFYLMWPMNSIGFGDPVWINKADARWMNGSVTNGMTASIFGRELDLGDGLGQVYITDGTSGQWVEQTNSNPYKLDFVIPSLSDGTYTAYAHNGHGGKYGWSRGIEFEVYTGYDFSAGTTYTVTTGGDALTKFNAAKDLAGPGDTIEFEAGTFLFDNDFKPEQYVRVKGQGPTNTIIGMSSNNVRTVFVYGADDALIEDLCFQWQTNGSYASAHWVYCSGVERTTYRNVMFDQRLATQSRNFGRWIYSTDLHFEDCDFYLADNLYLTGDGIFFDGCDFWGMWDCNTIGTLRANKVALYNSTFRNYDDSDPTDGAGWAKGRWFAGQLAEGDGGGAVCNDWYIGDNESFDTQPRDQDVDQNSGETFLTESETVRDYGNATASTSNTVTFATLDTSRLLIEAPVSIVSGRGQGQTRSIIATNGTTITVDENWRVEPDTSSRLIICDGSSRWAIYNNTLDARGPNTNTDRVTGLSAVQIYAGATQWVVDGNTISDYRNGLSQFDYFGPEFDPNVGSPVFFCEWKNNTITNSRIGVWLTVRRQSGTYVDDTLDIGGLVRGNLIQDSTTMAIDHWIGDFQLEASNAVSLTVFDGNTSDGSPFYDSDDRTLLNQVWIGNSATNTGGTGTVFSATSEYAMQENTFAGFSTDYAGTIPSGLLELPVRVGYTNATEQIFAVFNSGLTDLSVTANGQTKTISPASSTNFTYTTTSATNYVVSAGSDSKTFYVLTEDTPFPDPYGPELLDNGDGSDGTTWWTPINATLTNPSGEIIATSTSTDYRVSTRANSLEVGKTYRIAGTIVGHSGSGTPIAYYNYASGLNSSSSHLINSGDGDFVIEAEATDVTCNIVIRTEGASISDTVTVDDFSIKEVL